MEDVFKQQGMRTRLTQQTRDQGADIILIEGSGCKKSIVKVKRYAKHRKIGVNLVRELIDAQIIHGAIKSYFVTTSFFTKDAEKLGQNEELNERQIEVEFWDAIRFMRELEIYNEKIIPIIKIDPSVPLRDQLPKEYVADKRVLRPVEEISSAGEAESFSIVLGGSGE